MFKYIKALLSICVLISTQLTAQTTVAVAKFINQSDLFYLDSWEKLIPELLQSNLSSEEELIVLARDQLDKVLEEKALLQSGVIDSEQGQEIGDLLGAEFIITGSVKSVNDEIMISADIIRVKTGQVKVENVSAPDQKYLNTMIQFLADNIEFELTRKGGRREKILLKSRKMWYYLGVSIGSGIGAALMHKAYRDNWDNYKTTTDLDKFDLYYDRANSQRKWYIGFSALGAVSLGATIVSWIQNQNAPAIHAYKDKSPKILPVLYVGKHNEISIGAKIHF